MLYEKFPKFIVLYEKSCYPQSVLYEKPCYPKFIVLYEKSCYPKFIVLYENRVIQNL
jgi:hypothetical protein